MRVKSVYEYAGANETELSFSVGELIDVIDEGLGDGWKQGRLVSTNQTGWFPEAYCENVDSSAASAVPAAGFADNDDWGNSAAQAESGQDSYYSGNQPLQRTGTKSSGGTLNRLSMMSSAGRGSDDFLGVGSKKEKECESALKIVLIDGPRWKEEEAVFTVSISNPEKKSKLAGMKEFIAYSVVSTNGHTVERRYKHFDWLNDRIAGKFHVFALPPLPEKQIAGRFDDNFIEHRRMLLEKWINRIIRNPVLRNSEVIKHFLTCTDEDEWKNGKRKAEKDPVTGTGLFLTVVPPSTNAFGVDGNAGEMVQFGKFMKTMQKDVQTTISTFESFNKTSEDMARQYERLGFMFGLLSGTTPHRGDATVINNMQSWDSRHDNTDMWELTQAISETSKVFKQVSEAWKKEPVAAVNPLVETLKEWSGLIPGYAAPLEQHAATNRKLQQPQSQNDPNMSKKAGLVFNATLAEVNRFHDERRDDFNNSIAQFLQAHIDHHKHVTQNLEKALKMFQPVSQAQAPVASTFDE